MQRNVQDEILRLKKEKGVCILAHSYQSEEICEIADFVGDSFALAKKAKTTDAKTFLMCGVRFMAEGVKLLCPESRVILSSADAGCPMAEQFTKEDVLKFKAEHPDYRVVAYINTTAELKTVSDVCVTSSSAVKIVKNMEEKNILFIPDCNLARFVQSKVPEKNIVYWQGGCPRHAAVTIGDVNKAREAHPEALLLVHPECKPEISAAADYVGATSGIMDFAKSSDAKEFIIGTEISIVEHLQAQCPEKKFYPLSKSLICADMKLTTLYDVLDCLNGGGEEIKLSPETIEKAVVPIDRMIELG